MSSLLVELEQKAFTLPPDERAHLAEAMLESLRGTPMSEIETGWEQEIKNRVAAFDRGELQTHSATDVFANARRMVQ